PPSSSPRPPAPLPEADGEARLPLGQAPARAGQVLEGLGVGGVGAVLGPRQPVACRLKVGDAPLVSRRHPDTVQHDTREVLPRLSLPGAGCWVRRTGGVLRMRGDLYP